MTNKLKPLTGPEFVSYSANAEDVLLRRLFPTPELGFYVDVGAAHPIWDIAVHFFNRQAYFVPHWYVLACTSFDLAVAAYIALNSAEKTMGKFCKSRPPAPMK